MKKKFTAMLFALTLLFAPACKKKDEPHWSHKNCVETIAKFVGVEDYTYSVKELDYDYKHGDDEVYCFKIVFNAGLYEETFMCFAVVDDNEVLYVDYDIWEE